MNRIKELRKEKNLTQSQIAELLNISVKTVSRWENEEFEIKIPQAKMLSDIFGVSIPYLLGSTVEVTDPSDWGKILSVPSKEPNYETVEAGKAIFQNFTPPNSDKILENAIFEDYKNFYKEGKERNKGNLSEEDLGKFFNDNHVINSSSKRLNNFYQALPLLDVEEAAILSFFSLLSKEKKAAIYEILAGLIFPDDK